MGVKQKTVKTTVEIDSDLFYLAKLKALKQKKPLKEVINEGLAKHLGTTTTSKKKYRIKIGSHRLGGVKGSLRRIDIYEDI